MAHPIDIDPPEQKVETMFQSYHSASMPIETLHLTRSLRGSNGQAIPSGAQGRPRFRDQMLSILEPFLDLHPGAFSEPGLWSSGRGPC